MKKMLTIVLALFIFTTICQAQVYSTTTGGNWDEETSWVGGVLPGATDSVVIQGPITLYFDAPTVHDLLITESGSLVDGWGSTLTVTGNVWMNGTIQIVNGNFEFQVGGDLHVNGDLKAEFTFIGTNDHNLSTASDIIFDPSHIYAYESKIIAKSDIYVNAPGLCDFIVKEIDLSGGYSMYLKNTRIGGYSYFVNYGVRPKIIGAGNSITFSGTGQYYEYCDLQDVTLYGSSIMSSGVGFYGEVINEDTLAVGIVPQTINVYGNFTNNGFVGLFSAGLDYTSFNFHQNFTNNGKFEAGSINFLGANDHLLITTDQNWFTYRGTFNSDEGKIVAMSDLYIDSQYSGNLIAKEIDLTNGFDLHINNVRIGSNSASYRNLITGGGNSVYMSGGQGWFEKCDLYNVTLRGYSLIRGDVDFYEEVINADTLTNAGANVTVDVFGNFTNNGMIYGQSYDMNFNYYQNLVNNGYYNSMGTVFVGTDDQYISLLNNEKLLQYILFDSKFDSAPNSYQWVKNDENIDGEVSEKLTFDTGLEVEEAVYYCIGAFDNGNQNSRKIYVSNSLPSAFEIYDVAIANLSATSTQVTWKTTVPATGFIFYAENDATNGYPLEAMEEDGLVLNHSLSLDSLNTGSTYYFIIDQNDENWTNNVRSDEFSFVAGDTTVSVNEESVVSEFSLSQNYPNPFNPSTQINYSIPESGNVSLIIYDMLGREVKTIIDQFQNAGSYSIDFNAEELSSGVYFYRLSAGQFSETKKLMLVR